MYKTNNFVFYVNCFPFGVLMLGSQIFISKTTLKAKMENNK